MNKHVNFTAITSQNWKRFRYYQQANQPYSAVIDPVPIWLEQHHLGADTGTLATYFHITIRNHVHQRTQTTLVQPT